MMESAYIFAGASGFDIHLYNEPLFAASGRRVLDIGSFLVEWGRGAVASIFVKPRLDVNVIDRDADHQYFPFFLRQILFNMRVFG